MHLLHKAAGLWQNWLKECLVYASDEQWNLEKNV